MKLLIVSLLFCVNAFAQDQNLIERVYEGQSENKNAVAAKKEIQDIATEKVSEALIKELIGDAKYLRQKPLITQKIIRNSARYVPFSRTGEMQPAGEGFKMSVTLKVSMDILQKMLLENGLLYESDSTPAVLPMVRWMDRVSMKSFSWWQDGEDSSKAFLSKKNRQLEAALKAAFFKNQFYVFQPDQKKYSQFLAGVRTERPTPEDYQALSVGLGVQMVVNGEVSIVKSTERSDAYSVLLKLQAQQTQNGRLIAEVSRQADMEGGTMEASVDKKIQELLDSSAQDLATQVFDAWTKGTVGSSLYRLTLKGRLPLNLQETLKEGVRNRLREVKSIRERMISQDEIVYELDAQKGPEELSKKMADLPLGNFKMVLDSYSENGLVYKLVRSN